MAAHAQNRELANKITSDSLAPNGSYVLTAWEICMDAERMAAATATAANAPISSSATCNCHVSFDAQALQLKEQHDCTQLLDNALSMDVNLGVGSKCVGRPQRPSLYSVSGPLQVALKPVSAQRHRRCREKVHIHRQLKLQATRG